MKNKSRRFLKTTVAEPLPFFYGHVEYDHATKTMYGRPYSGPFYSAGSEWYHMPHEAFHAQFQADSLRAAGFTVTVEEVSR